MTTIALRQWRTVALPPEHGSWGLTLEPILLGLLVAPSAAGWGLALAAFSVFLLRWPLKVLTQSRQSKRRNLALVFCSFYALLAIIGLLLGVQTGTRPLLPFVLAFPFGVIFFLFDKQNKSRHWQAELAGPVAFSATATAIALASNWAMLSALVLWVVMVARAVPSVLYVRARLRLDRGKPHLPTLVMTAHIVVLFVIAWLAWWTWLPPLTIGIMGLLLARAVLGLSRYRRPVPIKVIGLAELCWGLLTVLVVAFGGFLLGQAL